MLTKIDASLNYVPSRVINRLTFGTKGASLCGRLYLYHRYINKDNKLVNLLISMLNSIETNHCEVAARVWRIKYLTGDIKFPKEYKDYLKHEYMRFLNNTKI